MKKVKILLISLMLLFAFCLTLSGCSETNTSNGMSSLADNSQNSKVKGSWFAVSCKVNGEQTDTSELFNTFYVINEDGTFDVSNNGNVLDSGTYTFDGTNLILSHINNKTTMTIQDNNKLLYKVNNDEGETEAIYERL